MVKKIALTNRLEPAYLAHKPPSFMHCFAVLHQIFMWWFLFLTYIAGIFRFFMNIFTMDVQHWFWSSHELTRVAWKHVWLSSLTAYLVLKANLFIVSAKSRAESSRSQLSQIKLSYIGNTRVLPNFWHERRRCSRSPFRWLTGNDVSGPLISPFFSFFSPSSTFLIEGVLGSKNLFSESGSKWAIT